MSNDIVVLNVSQISAPTPNTLQKKGALVSQGATTLTPGTFRQVSTLSEITALLTGGKNVASLTQVGGVATLTTSAPHGWANGEALQVVIAGATPVGYNGQHIVTVTGASTMTFPVSGALATPATGTISVILLNVSEVLAMGTTYFAQPAAPAVSVFETGPVIGSQSVGVFLDFITDNPGSFYSFLVPRDYAADSSFLTALAAYNTDDAKVRFFVTLALDQIGDYADNKCVFALVEATTLPVTEFTAAAPFAVTLGYSPSSTSLVTPLAFSYLFGVTAYDGTLADMATLKAGNANFVGTGAEGGISNTILYWGHLMDGRQFNYWYAADWEQINLDLNVANEVIQGSNNSVSPLYYNQSGIQRLQNRCVQVTGNAVSYGMANGQVVATRLSTDKFMANFRAGQYAGQNVVNADPFASYTAANPANYAAGTYGGLTVVFIPQLGFEQVVINLVITDIVS